MAPAVTGEVTVELRRGDDCTLLKTDAAHAATRRRSSRWKRSGAFTPEDRIGALELQNLSVGDNRALLLHYAQALALPTGGDPLKGLLEE